MPELLLKTETIKYRNAAIVQTLAALDAIHKKEKNIAIYERKVDEMKVEIDQMLKRNLLLRFSGSRKELLKKMNNEFTIHALEVPLIYEDVKQLLKTFEKISSAQSFRLNLLTVNSDMCRRFHTDINDLRLLCTYSGQGTYWLPEEAADRNRHHEGGENEDIVLKPDLIQQAKTGDVVILKGALYQGAKAAIHRSPAVEDSGENRLLLRIDTNSSLI